MTSIPSLFASNFSTPMPSTFPPRAVAHQQAIVRAIAKTFELSVTDLESLQRGGSRALEKLVRSYHYWATEYNDGICPYDHPRLGYFRMTAEAANHTGATKELHCEHVVPVRWIVSELMRIRRKSDSLNFQQIVTDLMTINEIIIVTKEQAKQMDKCLRYTMPVGWTGPASHLARLQECLGLSEPSLVGERLIGPEVNSAS